MNSRRIGIVTFPLSRQAVLPLSNLLDITNHIANQVYVVTGNAGADIAQQYKEPHFDLVNYTVGSNTVMRIYNYAKTQLRLTFHMVKQSKNVDFWIFPNGGEALLPCMVFAKLLRKPTIMILTASFESIIEHKNDPLSMFYLLFTKINRLLATKIVLYSPTLVPEWNLEKYHDKIVIAHRHFLDFNTFKICTPLPNRPPLIGYIGRLSEEKGLINFTQALPAILGEHTGFRVLIGGDGQLKETIEAILREEEIAIHADLPGWISRDDLPKYLNQLRLLVLPSYIFEGLPNIILEAIACGTPVLATPVGAISDVIIGGETGFIMENNSPECIAENVIRALNSPDLEQIAEDGRRFVEENFTFEKTVENWKKVLQSIEQSY